MITKKNLVYIIAWIVISSFIHELGHVIALWMLGVPSHIVFDITSLGPVLKIKWAFTPELSDIWFSAFFGPFFAGVTLMVIGKIKSEAYIAGISQLLHAPFELITVIMSLSCGNVLEFYTLFVVMVVFPIILVLGWGFDKIDERNK